MLADTRILIESIPSMNGASASSSPLSLSRPTAAVQSGGGGGVTGKYLRLTLVRSPRSPSGATIECELNARGMCDITR